MNTRIIKYIIIFSFLSTTLFSKEDYRYDIDYNVDIPIALTAFLIGLLPKIAIPETPSYMKDENLDSSKVNSIDSLTINNYSPNSAKASDILIYSLLVSPFAVNLIDNNNYGAESLIIFETISIAAALNNIVKYAVSRPRPYIYSGKASQEEIDNRDSHLSFFSGHSTLAFATAVSLSTIMSDRFEKTWQKSLIWGVPLLTASTIAYLRVRAGKHFISDVFVGSLVGASIGWLVPYLHKKTGGQLIGSGNSEGIYIGYNFTF